MAANYRVTDIVKYFLILLVLTFFDKDDAYSQFGQNKVQYRNYDWHYIESKHFDVYFYTQQSDLAAYTAVEAEKALASIENTLNYRLTRRIPLVVYNSHNEFQQTNVISEFMPEGVGGVTELFKNRIVIPFQGEYEQYRHVIHHELVHGVLNDMFHGGTLQSSLSAGGFFIPTWMNEGLAEYESLGGLNAETDMYMRDVTINEKLPKLLDISGYMSYRVGQTFYWYIAQKYGKEKVGDLINRLRTLRSVKAAFETAFNMDIDDFSDMWEREIKRYYWPDLSKFENVKDYATEVTDREKNGNFMNTSPSISPDGEKMAYIADDDGVYSIFIQNVDKSGKRRHLLSSSRMQDFEDLNILTPGISWDPTGKQLAISAKAGGKDAIYIIDADDGDYKKLNVEMPAISSVVWSPSGSKLAFVGSAEDHNDLFVYDMNTKTLKNITNNIFSEFYPQWSPDSRKLYFISDMGDLENRRIKPGEYNMWNHDIRIRDIYKIDIESGIVDRLTNDTLNDKTGLAVTTDETRLLYVSDKNGIGNIYDLDIATGVSIPKTNSLTRITQISLSRDASKLLFTTQIDAGYDIYLIRFPLERNLALTELPATTLKDTELGKEAPKDTTVTTALERSEAEETQGFGSYEIDMSRQEVVKPDKSVKPAAKATEERVIIGADGVDTNYAVKDYVVKFTPDIILSNPGYNTVFGVQGVAQMLFSDVLGDHQIYVLANLQTDIRNSTFFFAYNYLPKIVDLQFNAHHSSGILYLDTYNTPNNWMDDSIYHFRNYGAGAAAMYPFDLFNRFEFGLNWMNISMENIENPLTEINSKNIILPQARYVHDDAVWSMGFAPWMGKRYFISLAGSPKLGDNGLGFITTEADFRWYQPFFRYLGLALRGTGGASFGSEPQRFFVGGTENWINPFYRNQRLPFTSPEDFAFMNFITPLRGWGYSEATGSKYFLVNAELRFPILTALIAGPIPVLFQMMMGNVFFDMAGVWTNDFVYAEPDVEGQLQAKNLYMSTGVGLRTVFLGLPFKVDVAWRNEYHGWSSPVWMVSLGLDW